MRSEAGFTLIELMISTLVFAVVLAAVLSLLDVGTRSAYNDQERSLAMSEDTVGVHRMVSDLVQAYKVLYPTSGTTSDTMDVDVRETIGGSQQDRRVQYFCNQLPNLSTGYNQCLRYDDVASDGAAAGQPMAVTPTVVVPRVLNQTSADPNDPVFQSLSSPDGSTGRPTYGEVLVHTPGSGDRHTGYRNWVTFNDSFDMRQLAFAH